MWVHMWVHMHEAKVKFGCHFLGAVQTFFFLRLGLSLRSLQWAKLACQCASGSFLSPPPKDQHMLSYPACLFIWPVQGNIPKVSTTSGTFLYCFPPHSYWTRGTLIEPCWLSSGIHLSPFPVTGLARLVSYWKFKLRPPCLDSCQLLNYSSLSPWPLNTFFFFLNHGFWELISSPHTSTASTSLTHSVVPFFFFKYTC